VSYDYNNKRTLQVIQEDYVVDTDENILKKALSYNELFCAIGLLFRAALKLEAEDSDKKLVITLQEQENSEEDDPEWDTEAIQDIYDTLALLCSQLRGKKELILMCREYVLENYSIEIDEETFENSRSKISSLRLIKK